MSFFDGFSDELLKLAQSYIDPRQKTKRSVGIEPKKTSPELRKLQLEEKYRQLPPKPKPKPEPINYPVRGT